MVLTTNVSEKYFEMASFNKIFKLNDDRSVRTHVPGFHIPDFSKERYDADQLTAHLVIKHLRDLIDADHCAYLFDKNHELEDIEYLEEIRVSDVAWKPLTADG